MFAFLDFIWVFINFVILTIPLMSTPLCWINVLTLFTFAIAVSHDIPPYYNFSY